MGLDTLRKEQGIEVHSIEDYKSLARLQELAIMGMEAVESGEVEFTSMSEVMKALDNYNRERRLLSGGPTERSETTNINISLGGNASTPIKAVQALLAIAASIQSPIIEDDDDDDVIDVTPDD